MTTDTDQVYTTWYEAVSAYDETLDELHGTVHVAGYDYQTSRTLREIDPIAYRTGLDDWLDGEGVDSDLLEGTTDDDDDDDGGKDRRIRGSLDRGSLDRGSLDRGSLDRGSLNRGSLNRGSGWSGTQMSNQSLTASYPSLEVG